MAARRLCVLIGIVLVAIGLASCGKTISARETSIVRMSGSTGKHFRRVLKKAVSFVLASLRGSTYRSVRLASSLAAALLPSLFEHPARRPWDILAEDRILVAVHADVYPSSHHKDRPSDLRTERVGVRNSCTGKAWSVPRGLGKPA